MKILQLRYFIPSLLVAIVVAQAYMLSNHQDFNQTFLKVTLNSENGGVAQVFMDHGNGFSEDNSSRVSLNGGSNETIYLSLTEQYPSQIRFDPINASGSVEIHQIALAAGNGHEYQTILPAQIVANANFQQFETSDDGRISAIVTPASDDPQMIIQSLDWQAFGPKFGKYLDSAIRIGLLTLIITYALLWVYASFLESTFSRIFGNQFYLINEKSAA